MEYTFEAVLHEIPENGVAYVIFEIDDGNSMGTEHLARNCLRMKNGGIRGIV